MNPEQTISDFLLALYNFILLRLALRGGLFHSDFPTKLLYVLVVSPMRASCPANFILLYILHMLVIFVIFLQI
jgi:hypothetical protein